MKGFSKLMNNSTSSTYLLFAFVVSIVVFMFLVYRKRLVKENMVQARMLSNRTSALRHGNKPQPGQWRNPFSSTNTGFRQYTPSPYTFTRGQPGAISGLRKPYSNKIDDIRPNQGVLVYGQRPNPQNDWLYLQTGGRTGAMGMYPSQSYSPTYAMI